MGVRSSLEAEWYPDASSPPASGKNGALCDGLTTSTFCISHFQCVLGFASDSREPVSRLPNAIPVGVLPGEPESPAPWKLLEPPGLSGRNDWGTIRGCAFFGLSRDYF